MRPVKVIPLLTLLLGLPQQVRIYQAPDFHTSVEILNEGKELKPHSLDPRYCYSVSFVGKISALLLTYF